MKVREVLIAAVVAVILFSALLVGALFLLDAGLFKFRSGEASIDCTDPNSKLCRFRDFFKAKAESSIESRACVRNGLPTDCADL